MKIIFRPYKHNLLGNVLGSNLMAKNIREKKIRPMFILMKKRRLIIHTPSQKIGIVKNSEQISLFISKFIQGF